MSRVERKGKQVQANNGMWITCIEYIDSSNSIVKFTDGTVVEGVSWKPFCEGKQ